MFPKRANECINSASVNKGYKYITPPHGEETVLHVWAELLMLGWFSDGQTFISNYLLLLFLFFFTCYFTIKALLAVYL